MSASCSEAGSGWGLGRRLGVALLLCAVWATPSGTRAAEVYLPPEHFLAEAFGGTVPAPKVLWITGEAKTGIEDILGHGLGVLRLRYWMEGARTAWILEEIGKTQPITTGIVVDQGRIARISVLIYRESRGWEVRHSFFTDQFIGASLAEDRELDRGIDGISGATLSVRALTKLARLALFLHEQAMEQTTAHGPIE